MAAHGAPPPEPPIFRNETVRTAGQILTGPSLFSVFYPAPVLVRTITRSRGAGGNDTTGSLHPGRIGSGGPVGLHLSRPDVMPSTMDVRDSRSNRCRRSGSPVPLRRTHPALSRCGRGRG